MNSTWKAGPSTAQVLIWNKSTTAAIFLALYIFLQYQEAEL